MQLISQNWGALMALSAVAGAIHVLAPDHWVPASILSWQRRWRAPATVAFTFAVLCLHLILGAVVYFLLDKWVLPSDSPQMFSWALGIVLLVMLGRGLRFSKIQDVQRSGTHRLLGPIAVLSLLGPCESIIPIFIKASNLGVGYLFPFISFLAGSLVAGVALVLGGRWAWNHPSLLPRVLNWASQRIALFPVVVGMALGLRFLLRLG